MTISILGLSIILGLAQPQGVPSKAATINPATGLPEDADVPSHGHSVKEQQYQDAQQAYQNVAEAARDLRNAAYVDRLQNVIRRDSGSAGGKPLIIRSSDPDPKQQESLEQDLAVMSHILDKAAGTKPATQHQVSWAMGIGVVSGAGSTPARSLYLEGYGALFTLNVGFSLVPGPTSPAPKEPPAEDSTWEQARRELYGVPGGGRGGGQPGEVYDEEKVNSLKDSLIQALKNSPNIRGLKPDDSITICVLGGGGPATVRARSRVVAAPGGLNAFVDNPPASRGSVLTLRVKVSDAEAYSRNKMTLEEFRKHVKVSAYRGGEDGGGAMGESFFTPNAPGVPPQQY